MMILLVLGLLSFVHDTLNSLGVIIVCSVVEVKTVSGKNRKSSPTVRMIEGVNADDNVSPVVIRVTPTLIIVAPMWGLFGSANNADFVGHHYSRRLFIDRTCMQQSSKPKKSILAIVSACGWNTSGELRELLYESLLRSPHLYTVQVIQHAQDLLIGRSQPVLECLSSSSHRDYVEAFVTTVIETMKVVLGSKLPVDDTKRLKRKRPDE